MKISLVVSDVDATLITPEHKITPLAQKAVRDLRERGIAFIIASSRPPRGLYDFVQQLNLTAPFLKLLNSLASAYGFTATTISTLTESRPLLNANKTQ